MFLSEITLKGFRNFKDSKIKLNVKSLIIGANDIGKTNLLWAIRLLLDRSLSDYDIEPQDSDFYAYEETNEFAITLFFEDVIEDCIVSKLKGKISDDDKLFLVYNGFRDKNTKSKSYKLLAGHSLANLEEIEDRYYRNVLNIKYISSKRDFYNYINREKKHLFQIAKDNRTPDEVSNDDKLYQKIQTELKAVDDEIPKLNFVSSATKTINEELSKLSLHHGKQKVVFDATSSSIDKFIDSVSISSKCEGNSVLIGGDGRLNQIYLALWASRNELTEDNAKEVSIFCIEEPEAHLHPHQQRKLSEYLGSSISGQVLMTSHSPQIASQFSPNSIVRLYLEEMSTVAASGGCSEIIDQSFKDFGYRLSIIPAEAFFADVVLLIEGPSEELFYKTLSTQLRIDLDKLNISILMVDGVGFDTFINILNVLKIGWVLRTDNDIFKVPKKNKYRFAGVQRCVGFYRNYCFDEETEEILRENEHLLTGFDSDVPPPANLQAAVNIINELSQFNMYLSEKDLENDLLNSEIKDDIISHFLGGDMDIISKMQERKATFMYDFLRSKKDALAKLKKSAIAQPLYSCKKIVENMHNESN